MQRGGVGSSRRSCRRASTGRYAWPKRGNLQYLTQVVPGKPDRYYQIPFGMHWAEVKASSFMEVGINDGEVKRGDGDVERSCYCIHAPIHKALPQAKAVFHTHMPFASALTRL